MKSQNFLKILKRPTLVNRATINSRYHSTESINLSSKIFGTQLFVWGQLQGSSLGLGENDKDSPTPILLDNIDGSGYIDVSLGTNHCGIVTGNGDVYVFGYSVYGELGLNESVSSTSILSSFFNQSNVIKKPTKIPSLSNIRKISFGSRHSAAIDNDGNLYTWGYGGSRLGGCGGLGHGDKTSLNKPKLVEALKGEKIVDLACGEKHTIVSTEDGKVYSWGEGEHGRLGTGHTTNSKSPKLLDYFANQDIKIKKVYASKEYSFVLNNEGMAFGFGRNDRSQMGQGISLAMDMYSCDPTPIMLDLTNIVSMSLSHGDILAVDINGEIYNWGDRQFLEPTPVSNEKFQDEKPNGKIIDVFCSNSSFFFITDQGELFSCNKRFGMGTEIYSLGQGSVQPFLIARRVKALENEKVLKVVANDHRTCAICK